MQSITSTTMACPARRCVAWQAYARRVEACAMRMAMTDLGPWQGVSSRTRTGSGFACLDNKDDKHPLSSYHKFHRILLASSVQACTRTQVLEYNRKKNALVVRLHPVPDTSRTRSRSQCSGICWHAMGRPRPGLARGAAGAPRGHVRTAGQRARACSRASPATAGTQRTGETWRAKQRDLGTVRRLTDTRTHVIGPGDPCRPRGRRSN